MTTDMPHRNDKAAWEDYWRRVVSGSAAPPPWHFSSAEEMAPYLPWLMEHFDQDLPLIDGLRGWCAHPPAGRSFFEYPFHYVLAAGN